MAEIMFEHTIERAIIMAAGIGQRLRPVTLTTPKPLVTVNGVCMIIRSSRRFMRMKSTRFMSWSDT